MEDKLLKSPNSGDKEKCFIRGGELIDISRKSMTDQDK